MFGSWSWNLVVTVQDTGTVIQLCNEKAQKAIEKLLKVPERVRFPLDSKGQNLEDIDTSWKILMITTSRKTEQ